MHMCIYTHIYTYTYIYIHIYSGNAYSNPHVGANCYDMHIPQFLYKAPTEISRKYLPGLIAKASQRAPIHTHNYTSPWHPQSMFIVPFHTQKMVIVWGWYSFKTLI
jgi:hypothetical protein